MPEFTDNQKKAITHQGHNILVSASAGSGKTTVLIERLIQRIMAGTAVDQFLIVTFTRAAAGEMKERLEKALTARLQETDDAAMRAYLQEQLALLPTAAVTTIDGFALKLIESYYYTIDLDPAFRLVADNAEVTLFKQQVLDSLFDELYDDKHPDHLALMAAVNNFASVSRDQKLKDIILKLADFDAARPKEDNWLDSLAAGADENQPLDQQRAYQSYLTEQVRPAVVGALTELPEALSAVEGEGDEKKFQQVATALLEREAYLKNLLTLLDNDAPYEDLRAAIQQDFTDKFPSRYTAKMLEKDENGPEKAAQLELALAYKDRHFSGKTAPLQSMADGFFRLSEAQWQTVNARGQRIITDLVALTKDYLSALKEAKTAENVLHFSDLVVLARQILQDKDIQRLVQSQFAEVMVDEYQDVNRLQEAFLKDMSNGQNMYMVGDIKQSIYGFRQAAPQLFAGKYEAFAKVDNEDERIELADNFRSENNVTEVINQIFTQIMDEELGDVAYQGSAKLVAKAAFPEEVPAIFNLDLLALPKVKRSEAANDEEDESEEDDRDTREKTLTYLLQRVQNLVREGQVYDQKQGVMRPVNYGDIAILTRSKTTYPDLLRLAKEAGIPVQSESVGNYYQTMEVYLVLDLLRVIDNPHQDIPLAAVLRSPIFGFKENELAEIRLADERHDFYSALQAVAKEKSRAAKVLEQLANWRVFARQNDLVGLIWAIYQDTGWLDYVAGLPGGPQRQANLHALYQRAASFQENGQSGLFAFTRYIEEVQNSGGDVGEVAQESSKSAVSLMTIHKSKGLEFPIVLLPDLDKPFNKMDSSGDFILHKDAGIGLNYLEENAQVKLPTIGKYAVKQALKKQAWSEEMRLYYVALTRAKQQLYLIGRIDPLQDKVTREQKLYQNALQSTDQFLPAADRLAAQSYLDWTLQSFARLENADLDALFLADKSRERQWLGAETNRKGQVQVRYVLEETLPNKNDLVSPAAQVKRQEEPHESAAGQAIDQVLLVEKLSYHYPYEQATQTAAYQSVSEIKQLFEDPDRPYLTDLYLDEEGRAVSADDAVAKGLADEKGAETKPSQNLLKQELPLPSFMSDGKVKPSPTAVGTATHLMMQLLDFNRWLEEADLEKLLAQLVASGKIAPEVAPLVNVSQIVDFTRSDFAQTIARHQKSLKREAAFAMVIPAKKVYPNLQDEQPILVHGIIDGYFIDESQKTITLFDYKTDFVPKRAGDRQKQAIRRLQRNYRGQLNLYRQALQDEYPDYQVLPGRIVSLSANLVLTLD